MISPPNDRSRPQAAPESFGGDTYMVPQATDAHSTNAPSWDDVVLATCEAQAEGFRLGYHAGLLYAAGERDAEVLRARAAEVVLNAAKDLHVARLRRSA